jgi:hypothetical protein
MLSLHCMLKLCVYSVKHSFLQNLTYLYFMCLNIYQFYILILSVSFLIFYEILYIVAVGVLLIVLEEIHL